MAQSDETSRCVLNPLDGIFHETSSSVDLEFLLNVGTIRLNGFNTQVESVGNLAGLEALTDQAKYG